MFCSIDENVPKAFKGDPTRVRQILTNLLSNAIKYTPESGFIKMNTYRSDGFVRMEIEDTAATIPTDDLEKIFDKFKRLESKVEGTGLGLAVSKKIVDDHGGHISCTSKRGEGTTFHLTFPLRRTETTSKKEQEPGKAKS